jgi:hypothetical protein
MAKSKSVPKSSEKAASTRKGATLDIVLCGPLLFVPAVESGGIASVEVYAPQNGHPIGAVFLPGIRFTDAELNDPLAERWPPFESFSLIDAHSYSVELEQTGKSKPFPVASIPANNYKVKAGRRLSHDWDISLGVTGKLSSWTSHRNVAITEGMLGGSDAPTVASVTNTQKLTYEGVKAAHFYGIAKPQQEFLKANIAKGGTLIVLGEVPYQASILHERQAVDALAKLAGLDLHLLSVEPVTNVARLMGHIKTCAFSTLLVP